MFSCECCAEVKDLQIHLPSNSKVSVRYYECKHTRYGTTTFSLEYRPINVAIVRAFFLLPRVPFYFIFLPSLGFPAQLAGALTLAGTLNQPWDQPWETRVDLFLPRYLYFCRAYVGVRLYHSSLDFSTFSSVAHSRAYRNEI